jgi:hypothetical protein
MLKKIVQFTFSYQRTLIVIEYAIYSELRWWFFGY